MDQAADVLRHAQPERPVSTKIRQLDRLSNLANESASSNVHVPRRGRLSVVKHLEMLEHLPYLASKRIILASASPRRLQLLQLVGLDPKVVSSTFAEDLSKADFPRGADYAVATSRQKAIEVANRLQSAREPFDLIIGADTVSFPS